MLIELHIIQNFPPSNLNRDDLGQPKDADFGGHRRARISSQCLKRSTRYAGRNEAAGVKPIFVRRTKVELGVRTKLIVRALTKLLEQCNHLPKESELLAAAFAEAYAGGFDASKGETNVLIYLSVDEQKWVAEQIHAKWNELMAALAPTTPVDVIAQQLVQRIAQRTQQPTKNDGVAVRKVSAEVATRLIQKGKDEKDAKKMASAFKKSFDAANATTKFVSASELDWLAGEIVSQWDTIEASMKADSPLVPIVEAMLEQTENRTGAPDIALFGRMLADKPTTNIDAACQVAHAISTHAIAGKTPIDYYTAMDDLKSNKEPGAGFLDTAYFNSACFYRYARLDYEQLKANLRAEDLQGNSLSDLPARTVEAFLRASEAAIPSGKKNSTAAECRPSFMLAVLRDKESEGWSLVNAFQKPVNAHVDGDLIVASVKKLQDRFEHLISSYSDETVKAIAVALPDGEVMPSDLNDRLRGSVKNMNDWVQTICSQLA